ncbi:hypothetical protein CVT26_002451 [Gymnopilus dilepis]|uniref:Uncharacterized protein n=1 Tax=Gymnopilus dilepis TaxID=231916 RepID=A0A409VT52_9AGAR|nr:hypothetical protein CVT26_002451 [Gymnopilus dilepis]
MQTDIIERLEEDVRIAEGKLAELFNKRRAPAKAKKTSLEKALQLAKARLENARNQQVEEVGPSAAAPVETPALAPLPLVIATPIAQGMAVYKPHFSTHSHRPVFAGTYRTVVPAASSPLVQIPMVESTVSQVSQARDSSDIPPRPRGPVHLGRSNQSSAAHEVAPRIIVTSPTIPNRPLESVLITSLSDSVESPTNTLGTDSFNSRENAAYQIRQNGSAAVESEGWTKAVLTQGKNEGTEELMDHMPNPTSEDPNQNHQGCTQLESLAGHKATEYDGPFYPPHEGGQLRAQSTPAAVIRAENNLTPEGRCQSEVDNRIKDYPQILIGALQGHVSPPFGDHSMPPFNSAHAAPVYETLRHCSPTFSLSDMQFGHADREEEFGDKPTAPQMKGPHPHNPELFVPADSRGHSTSVSILSHVPGSDTRPFKQYDQIEFQANSTQRTTPISSTSMSEHTSIHGRHLGPPPLQYNSLTAWNDYLTSRMEEGALGPLAITTGTSGRRATDSGNTNETKTSLGGSFSGTPLDPSVANSNIESGKSSSIADTETSNKDHPASVTTDIPSERHIAVPYVANDINSLVEQDVDALCNSPRLKEAQDRALQLRQVVTALQTSLEEKTEELQNCGNDFQNITALDFVTILDRARPIHDAVKRLKLEVDTNSDDLHKAESHLSELYQHERDLVSRLLLEKKIGELSAQLDDDRDDRMDDADWLRLRNSKKYAAQRLAEVKARLQLSSTKFETAPAANVPADTSLANNVLTIDVPANTAPGDNVPAVNTSTDSVSADSMTVDSGPAVGGTPTGYDLAGSDARYAGPSEDPGRRVSRKRKNAPMATGNNVPDTHYTGSEEPLNPKKRAKTSQDRQKDSKIEDGSKDDSRHPRRLSASRLKEIVDKVISRIERMEAKRKNHVPSSDVEIDEVDMPDRDDPLSHQSPIPGLTMSEYRELEAGSNNVAIEEGKAQLSDFILTGKAELIDRSIRLFAMSFQGFLGLSSFQTRELGLVIHDTGEKGLCCRYHAKFKTGTIYDQVGYPSVEGAAIQPGEAGTHGRGDTMNCGCLVDDVLFDYFFWKTWTARPTKPSNQIFEETMRGIIIAPRLRTFICQAFCRFTRLSVADVYQWSKSGTNFMIYSAVMQIQRLVKELGEAGIRVDVTGDTVRWIIKGDKSSGKIEGGGAAP